MDITAYWLAQRFVGIEEINGDEDNPRILSWLRHDNAWPQHDEVPWCSGFANEIAWELRLPRSKSLRARSWLRVGTPVTLEQARPAFDVVILKRGSGNQPGPDVIDAPGHVGFFAGVEGTKVLILGGNQSDSVSVARFPVSRILGIRRLRGECE